MLEAEEGSKVKGKIIKHSSVFSEYRWALCYLLEVSEIHLKLVLSER